MRERKEKVSGAGETAYCSQVARRLKEKKARNRAAYLPLPPSIVVVLEIDEARSPCGPCSSALGEALAGDGPVTSP